MSQQKPSSSTEPREGWRETIESIVVAFILAFLFRTFEVEAFVIPTGSMAPTLLGRHKDVECPLCKYHFPRGVRENDYDDLIAICPSCGNDRIECSGLPTFKGDRILVLKLPYLFGSPQRWDVSVFKNPKDPWVNYIKRLVGLPNELVEIRNGDIYIDGQIARKPLQKVRAMRIIAYDNNYIPQDDPDWRVRWEPQGRWQSRRDGTEFEYLGAESAAGVEYLRYHHYARRFTNYPDYVTDLYGYNRNRTAPESAVNDLMLVCDLEAVAGRGQIGFELFEHEQPLTVVFDLDQQQAEIHFRGQSQPLPTPLDLAPNQRYRLEIGNFDDRFYAAVNGVSIVGEGFDFQGIEESARLTNPANIWARGGDFRVRNLRLYRDIHYTPSDMHREDKYQLKEGEFFALGDNSPSSQDSRRWQRRPQAPEVSPWAFDQRALVGRAFLVYWPHGVPVPPQITIPLGKKQDAYGNEDNSEVRVGPFYPNLKRVKLIR